MAKAIAKSTEVKSTKKQEVQVTNQSSLLAMMEQDAGLGTSNDTADNLVPLIYVLQKLSQAVDKQNPEYIKGAEPGDIWLRNAPEPIAKKIRFQPCFFYKQWVEWIPLSAGGGFVGATDERPDEAIEAPNPKNANRKVWLMPNGNELSETRYHVGNVLFDDGLTLPYIIPFSSSGHTVSRQWMFLMNSRTLPNGVRTPSWATTYELTTKLRKNAAGSWHVLDINIDDWVSDEVTYNKGKALYNAFSAGALKPDVLPEDIAQMAETSMDDEAL